MTPSKQEIKDLLNLRLLSQVKGYLEEKLAALREEFLDRLANLQLQKGERGEPGPKPVAGVDYPIPQDGQDYVLTEADKQEIASKIEVPVVEKVVEKTVIKEQPIVTEITKEVAVGDSAEDLRNKLELLADEERLKIEAIHNLREELDKLHQEIEAARQAKTGGGTSAMGVAQAFKWILKTEQPSGAIDGLNTEYTVSKSIFAVLSFSLNGEVIAQLPNYTISGKKIIFSSALPAAYSGKDFEIKYV